MYLAGFLFLLKGVILVGFNSLITSKGTSPA